MAYFREVSPAEYCNLAADQPGYSPTVNGILVEGVGELDLQDWEVAVRKAADANPGSRLMLKGRWFGRYWDDAGKYPTVTKVSTDWDGMSSIGEPAVRSSINPRKDPTCEVILLDGESPKVLLKSHHGVMDGIGSFILIEEFFRALRGEPLLGALDTRSHWDIAMEAGRPDSIPLVPGKCPPPVPCAIDPTNQYGRWIRLDWSGSQSKLTERVLLVLGRLVREVHGDECQVSVRVATDTRRYIKGATSLNMGNAASYIDFPIDADANVESIRRSLFKALRNKSDLYPSKGVHRWVKYLPGTLLYPSQAVCAKWHRQGYYLRTANFSHISDRDQSLYQYNKFRVNRMLGIPIPIPTRPFFLTIARCGEVSSICIGMPAAVIDDAGLVTMRERFKEELVKLS